MVGVGNIQGGIAWGGIMSGIALYSIAWCGFECGAAISSCPILRVSYNKGVHLIPRNKTIVDGGVASQ